MHFFTPTSEKNIYMRLLLRYLFIYFLAFALGASMARRGLFSYLPYNTNLLGYLPIVLALFAAFLTVSSTYLVLLTCIIGFYKSTVFIRILNLTRIGEIRFWSFNACFLLLTAALILFLAAVIRASLFAHQSIAKNLRLLLSKGFLRFLADAMALLILSLLITILWQRLLLTLPLI